MPTLTITIDVTTDQADKLKEAVEYASGQTLTFAEAEAIIRQWVIRNLRHEAKSYLADKRRAAGATADESLIEQIEEGEV